MKIFKTLICCSLALSAQFAFAQDNTEDTSIEVPQEMERIQVKGKKPKLFYLSEYRRHQTDFVNMFNQLVDDSEMEVICEMESATGSRMKKRTCQPRFMKTIVAEETQRDLSRGSSFQEAANAAQRENVQKELIEEYKKFQKLTAQLLNKHSDLANSYVKMDEALTKYEEYETN
jgi:Skp family chaperone for outer membrane proteins